MRIIKAITAIFLLVALLTITFPQVASLPYFNSYVAKAMEKRLGGILSFDALSLSWWAPQTIEAFSWRPDGSTYMEAKQLKLTNSLYSLFFDDEPLTLKGEMVKIEALGSAKSDKTGYATAATDLLYLTFDRESEIVRLNVHGTTQENGSSGQFEIEGEAYFHDLITMISILKQKSSFPVVIEKNGHPIKINAQLQRIPPQLIDSLLTLVDGYDDRWKGIISLLFGGDISLQLNSSSQTTKTAGKSAYTTTMELSLQSPRLTVYGTLLFDGEKIALAKPLKVKGEISPSLQPLLERASGQLLPLQLTEETSFQVDIAVMELSLPLPARVSTLPNIDEWAFTTHTTVEKTAWLHRATGKMVVLHDIDMTLIKQTDPSLATRLSFNGVYGDSDFSSQLQLSLKEPFNIASIASIASGACNVRQFPTALLDEWLPEASQLLGADLTVTAAVSQAARGLEGEATFSSAKLRIHPFAFHLDEAAVLRLKKPLRAKGKLAKSWLQKNNIAIDGETLAWRAQIGDLALSMGNLRKALQKANIHVSLAESCSMAIPRTYGLEKIELKTADLHLTNNGADSQIAVNVKGDIKNVSSTFPYLAAATGPFQLQGKGELSSDNDTCTLKQVFYHFLSESVDATGCLDCDFGEKTITLTEPLKTKVTFSKDRFQKWLAMKIDKSIPIVESAVAIHLTANPASNIKTLEQLGNVEVQAAVDELTLTNADGQEQEKLHNVTLFAQANLQSRCINLDIGGNIASNKSKDNETIPFNLHLSGCPLKNSSMQSLASFHQLPASLVELLLSHSSTGMSSDNISAIAHILGSTISGSAEANVVHSVGTFALNIKGNDGYLSTAGRLDGGSITLDKELEASLNLTPLLKQKMAQLLPLLSEVSAIDGPLQLSIAREGFRFSLKNPWPVNFQVSRGVIHAATLRFYNRSKNGIFGLLVKNGAAELTLKHTPIYFSMKNGVFNVARTDLLLADSYPIALWGTIDIPNDAVDMVIGITPRALQNAFGVDKLKGAQLLTLPWKGSLRKAKIDKKVTTAKIAALLVQEQGLYGQLFGAFLDVASGNSDTDAPPPPTTLPLPWQTD